MLKIFSIIKSEGSNMKIKLICSLLVISLFCMTSNLCKSKEDEDVLGSKLNYAINQQNPFQAARLFEKLIKCGVDPETLPVTEVAMLVLSNTDAFHEGLIKGKEWIKLLEPLEGYVTGTRLEHHVRGLYFLALMDVGKRERALELWEKSKDFVASSWKVPYVFDTSKLSSGERMLHLKRFWAYWYFTFGFVSSENTEDKHKAVEMAKKYYDWVLSCSENNVKDIQLTVPATQAQKIQIMSDRAYALLAFCLVECGYAADANTNPFLKDQPKTNIRFQIVENTGLEECTLRTPYNDLYNRIALGDFDGDDYVDVLIPHQGLWRNLGGSGKFKRVDKELVVDIDGQCGAFADINNDGLVDIITASPNKFDVLLQEKSQIFRPVLNASNVTAENPAAICLFDGDCDGRIDIYLAGDENPQKLAEGAPDVVLHNQGDGSFEDVTEAWSFSSDDTMLFSRGVSPVDYDNDGCVDIYISNHRHNRNTLWRNENKDNHTFFFQCAASPQFGKKKKTEIAEGTEQSVEGWGHTQGSAWGDLNGDGTLDLVCANFAHPVFVFLGYSDISRIYLNTGNAFTDNTLNSGLAFRETIGDPMLADFNNDGHLDLSITNYYRVYINQIYEGVGNGTFNEVTFRTGAFACNTVGQASGDFDNDGDIDWFVLDGNRGLLLYENKLIENGMIPPEANWIQIRLHGRTYVNSMAYGARVTVRAKNKIYIREVNGMRGASNCDDQIVHIGLGDYTDKVDLEVRWIGDKIQKVTGLDINKRHVIIFGQHPAQADLELGVGDRS
jgi:hypothetical protein